VAPPAPGARRGGVPRGGRRPARVRWLEPSSRPRGVLRRPARRRRRPAHPRDGRGARGGGGGARLGRGHRVSVRRPPRGARRTARRPERATPRDARAWPAPRCAAAEERVRAHRGAPRASGARARGTRWSAPPPRAPRVSGDARLGGRARPVRRGGARRGVASGRLRPLPRGRAVRVCAGARGRAPRPAQSEMGGGVGRRTRLRADRRARARDLGRPGSVPRRAPRRGGGGGGGRGPGRRSSRTPESSGSRARRTT
jgi:hypothetical protein